MLKGCERSLRKMTETISDDSLKQMKCNLELYQELKGTEVEEPVEELQIGSPVDSMQFCFRE